jgi:hypothetical protein
MCIILKIEFIYTNKYMNSTSLMKYFEEMEVIKNIDLILVYSNYMSINDMEKCNRWDNIVCCNRDSRFNIDNIINSIIIILNKYTINYSIEKKNYSQSIGHEYVPGKQVNFNITLNNQVVNLNIKSYNL